jgi:hypothetical protein
LNFIPLNVCNAIIRKRRPSTVKLLRRHCHPNIACIDLLNAANEQVIISWPSVSDLKRYLKSASVEREPVGNSDDRHSPASENENGAPEEIRTPDPQIRRLLRVVEFKGVFCKMRRWWPFKRQWLSRVLAK